MTVLQEVTETFKNFEKGTLFSTAEIKTLVNKKYGRNPASVIPSDYCDNITNKGKVGTLKEFKIFHFIKRGLYEYIG